MYYLYKIVIIHWYLGGIFFPLFVNHVFSKPNFIVMFCDDVGYGDFYSYGHPTQEKNAIDILASEGIQFMQWYSASSLCSPSRAALLTGRYPIRSGIVGPDRVFWIDTPGGLPKSEVTIAEILKENGYATGIVGKWHLGVNEKKANDGKHLPSHHGFSFVGNILPFGYHWMCNPKLYSIKEMSRKCFLYYGDSIYEQPINSKTLTVRLRDDSVKFIDDNKDEPFFLYLAFPQTHSKVFCSSKFCNKSRRGAYGDSINEMAWVVDEVTESLRRNNLDKNTLVFFLSDNGPQTTLCIEGGSNGILKGGKCTTWDGGIRVPAVAWWPGTIAPGKVNHDVVSTMDIYPTMLELAGIESKSLLDGTSIANVLLRDEEVDPDRILLHYCSDVIMAARVGPFKIHFRTQESPPPPNPPRCVGGLPQYERLDNFNCSYSTAHDPPLVFNMDFDPQEDYPLNPRLYGDVIMKASRFVEEHRRNVIPVASQLARRDPNVLPCCSPPLCQCNYALASADKDEL